MLDLRLDQLESERQRVKTYAERFGQSGGAMRQPAADWASHMGKHNHALLKRQEKQKNPPPLLRKTPTSTADLNFVGDNRNTVEWLPTDVPTSTAPSRNVNLSQRDYPRKNAFVFSVVGEMTTLMPEAWSQAFAAWNRRRALTFSRMDCETSNVTSKLDWLGSVASHLGGLHFVASDYERMP